ncbi:MAG: NAD(P)/FAD-dependent oxidoreductase [Betaproteobacteria bacterium]|nr:MAG: NAD(P)/FAD-dependent oxidoreductase [Betaproteobacteria bacterium]
MTASTEIAIVGAGPAGIAAALAASQAGARVVLIDAMLRAGGRVWANGSGGLSSIDALAATGITHRAGTRVVAATHRELLLEDANDAATLRFERLILATGAREIQLPFPGWTLPGVVAAGGLQLMVKSGLRLDGRRVVVAGSGPLLLAAAASARQAGAQVLCVAEQAPRSRLARFALRLARYPDRALQALQLRMALAHTPYRAGWRVVEARRGDAGAWHVVLVDRAERLHRFDVDLLAVGYSLTPELQLASLLGCRLRDDPAAIETDVFGASSVPGVYAAGEAAGVGGWRKAWVEGRIAGLAAAGRLDDARALFPRAAKERAYAALLHEAFAPRRDESPLCSADTLVCRCEDVPYAALAACGSWREARLQQRCGMGHCQGRLCATALSILQGWPLPQDSRVPIVPARASTLTHLA